jgi:hypothetical protein
MPADERRDRPDALHTLMLRLDLAMEVLEGLDELGVETRTELMALLEHLERQVSESQ